jgi:hypothetical protein
MTEDIRELIQQHRAFYEVRPHYLVAQCRQDDGDWGSKIVQAGFDIDIYGAVTAGEWQPTKDYRMAHASAEELLRSIAADVSESCSMEAIPFNSSVFLDHRNQMQRHARLRIRIRDRRSLTELAQLSSKSIAPDSSETRLVKEVEARLQELGVSSRAG